MARRLPRDFSEFLQFLNEKSVRYLVVGGYAVRFYGHNRTTKDFDVWIGPGEENATRLVEAVRQFGFNEPDLSPDTFRNPKRLVRMGIEPNMIELIMRISGVEFESCYERRTTMKIGGVPVNFISLPDLRTNKAASARNRDLDDLENLPPSEDWSNSK